MSVYYCIECDSHKDHDEEPSFPHPLSYSHSICTTCAIEKEIYCHECEEVIVDPNYIPVGSDMCHHCLILKEDFVSQLEKQNESDEQNSL